MGFCMMKIEIFILVEDFKLRDLGSYSFLTSFKQSVDHKPHYRNNNWLKTKNVCYHFLIQFYCSQVFQIFQLHKILIDSLC